MPFVDTNSLRVVERLPGWFGRYPEEEVYEVIEGELEVTIDGAAGAIIIATRRGRISVNQIRRY